MPYPSPSFNFPPYEELIDTPVIQSILSRLDALQAVGGDFPSFFTVSISGVPLASQKFGYASIPPAVSIDPSLCNAQCEVAASATTTFVIMNGGTAIGTIVFPPTLYTGVITFNTGATALPANGFIKIIAPATPDATLSGIGITLGYR